MGSSAKKKREKKQAFQKTKLKVGKTKPKPDNFTSTAFSSRKIALSAQRAISSNAPTLSASFAHHVSLLSSSSQTQRRDSLAHLAHLLQQRDSARPLPVALSTLLSKLLPNLTSPSASVRANTFALLRILPGSERHVATLFMQVRVALTNLVPDVRLDAAKALGWLVEKHGRDVVSCQGGWLKGLRTMCTVLGWEVKDAQGRGAQSATQSGNKGWTKPPKAGSKEDMQLIAVLGAFLREALIPTPPPSSQLGDSENKKASLPSNLFPVNYSPCHRLPATVDPFRRLNLFGTRDEPEDLAYTDRYERWDAFVEKGYREATTKGAERAKKEGGEIGRAAKIVEKVLDEAAQSLDYQPKKAS